MVSLSEIAEELQGELGNVFQTTRVSSLQNEEQFLRELKSLNPDKLPGVIIVFDSLGFLSDQGIGESGFTLVMVDRFVAGSDGRALSVLRAGANLLALFPPGGRMLGGVFVHPVQCLPCSPDPQFAALALSINCKQGF